MACPLLVEPDHAVRDVLYQILDAAGFAVRTVEDEAAAFALVQDHQPGAILLNTQLVFLDTVEFLRRYHQLPRPQAPVIVLAPTDESGAAALAAGAARCLIRPFEIDDLMATVGQYTRPEHPPTRSAIAPGLTLREWEVAYLIAQGCSNPDIARELGLTEEAAAHHVRQLLLRLGLHTRVQLAVWVIRQWPDGERLNKN